MCVGTNDCIGNVAGKRTTEYVFKTSSVPCQREERDVGQ